jgi:glycosyltransferase involved in cell wall biosynthesis
MKDPVVTILMPAYNCENYIGQAIKAILRQTFNDFEFIIINDGSTDNTKHVIQLHDDERIRYYENETNCGIIKTLNRGLDIAKGKYILRTDADDIAVDNMVFLLADFMESHNGYIVCGGQMKLIGSEKIFSYPEQNDALKVYTLNACPFSHSTVIFRKSVLDKKNIRYEELFKDGEDHGLWATLLPLGKFHNLKKITLFYRESASQITAGNTYDKNYNETQDKIFSFQAKEYFELNPEDTKLYVKLIKAKKKVSLKELDQIGKVMVYVLRQNKSRGLFNNDLLKKMLFIKWHWACYNSYYLGKGVFKIYIKYTIASKNLMRLKSIVTHFFNSLRF